MKRKSRGQTLVEFALVFPIMMVFFFGIIDMAYYVYSWAEVQFAARRGAEEATQRQPREARTSGLYDAAYLNTDPCLAAILTEAQRNGALSGETQVYLPQMTIRFYPTSASNTADASASAKSPGHVVQVQVRKSIQPLTPLTNWIMGGRNYTFNAFSRRTIITNGPLYIDRVLIGSKTANYNDCIYE